MANDRRVARVASLIKREVSQMLMAGIKDDRVGAGMVSVTDVDVSGDLQHAKIFVSIYGTEEARAETMEGLKAATGFVRSELGHRVRLRRTPEVIFKEDRSMERGTQVLSLLNQLSQERAGKDDILADETIDARYVSAYGDDLDEDEFDEDDMAEDDMAEDSADAPIAEDDLD